MVYKDTDIYDKDNFYRVAWGNYLLNIGFLRPAGIGKTHIGKTKIELYRYKYKNKATDSPFNNDYVPPVYYDFIWNNHEKYEGFLTVQLIATEKPKYHHVADD